MNSNEMSEVTERQRKELTEEINDLFPEDPTYKRWYARLLNDLKDILRKADIATLPLKYQMGKAILEARSEWLKAHPALNKKGVTEEVMNSLRKDLQYSRAILYDCLRFADPPKKGYQRFRHETFEEFAEHRWEVKRTDSTGVESTLKVLGNDLTWTEVRTQVIRGKHRVASEESGASSDALAPDIPPSSTPTTQLPQIPPLLPVSAPYMLFTIRLPSEILQRFRQVAKPSAEEVLADCIQRYVNNPSSL